MTETHVLRHDYDPNAFILDQMRDALRQFRTRSANHAEARNRIALLTTCRKCGVDPYAPDAIDQVESKMLENYLANSPLTEEIVRQYIES